jgi:hypothetical protein
MNDKIKSIPIIGNLAKDIYGKLKSGNTKPQPFPGSAQYWENRYAAGGNSGVGSYDKFAEFKADVINQFVVDRQIQSAIEFGCGDGNQLKLANYPHYIGFDVSDTIISLCQHRFADDDRKTFKLMRDYQDETSDLTLSLDVIYHLVEDEVFENYIRTLFTAATRYVIIYSDNEDGVGDGINHVRHRKFTQWIESHISGWQLQQHIPNKYPYQGDYTTGSIADFYIYEKM